MKYCGVYGRSIIDNPRGRMYNNIYRVHSPNYIIHPYEKGLFS